MVRELAQRRRSSVVETLDAALEALRRDEVERAAAAAGAASPLGDAGESATAAPVEAPLIASIDEIRRADRSHPLLGLGVILAIDAIVIWVLRLIF